MGVCSLLCADFVASHRCRRRCKCALRRLEELVCAVNRCWPTRWRRTKPAAVFWTKRQIQASVYSGKWRQLCMCAHPPEARKWERCVNTFVSVNSSSTVRQQFVNTFVCFVNSSSTVRQHCCVSSAVRQQFVNSSSTFRQHGVNSVELRQRFVNVSSTLCNLSKISTLRLSTLCILSTNAKANIGDTQRFFRSASRTQGSTGNVTASDTARTAACRQLMLLEAAHLAQTSQQQDCKRDSQD